MPRGKTFVEDYWHAPTTHSGPGPRRMSEQPQASVSCILDLETHAAKENAHGTSLARPACARARRGFACEWSERRFPLHLQLSLCDCRGSLWRVSTCLVLDPGKATQAELVIGTILLAGLGFLFFAGFVWCRRFGVWATRRGVLVRYIPGRTKFLPWAAIAAFEPGMHDGVELRSLTARMVDGTTHMVPIFYRTDGQRDFLSSTITPEGARYVGSNVNPAVVLPQLLDLYRQGRLGV